jgi:DNA-binding response OmpR family regulator
MNKVLIVDDDPSILMSIEFLVKKAGHQAFIARSGEEALVIYERESPRVVLLDIMMPGMDGYDVCERIRAFDRAPRPYIVFLSAKNRELDIKKGFTVGGDLYVTKPFSTRQLVDTINKAIAAP